MRDGVYKNLPMPREYRSLVRSCAREAERGHTARRLAEQALEQDARRELARRFLRRLQQMASGTAGALPGLSALAACDDSKEAGGRNSPLESLVLAQAQQLERKGIRGEELSQRAVAEGILRWQDRQIRQIEQHCVVEAGAAARPIVDAAREAFASVDVRPIAERLLAGAANSASPRRAQINLDEDLVRPR